MISGSVGFGQLGRFQLGGAQSASGILVPTPIPSASDWSAHPTIVGGLNNIAPTPIPPAQAWSNPTVAGPVTVTTPIPSSASWNSPTVKLSQTVSPTAIPSSADWSGVPRVANVQTVAPSPIPSMAAWPSPTVAGSTQFISVIGGIPSSANWPASAVTGGAGQGSVQVFVAGVDVTNNLSMTDGTFTITGQTIGRWKLSVQFEQGLGVAAWRPRVGQTLMVMDHGARIFAGCITSVVTDRVMSTDSTVKYYVTATDKTAIFDRRLVRGKTYYAGADVYATIQDIWTNFLNGEGISLAGVPSDGSLGVLESDITCNYNTVSQALDSIDQQIGTIHWVDVWGVLWVSPMTSLPAAPWSVVEDADAVVGALRWRNAQGNYGLTVEETTQDYYNVLYAVSNLSVVPGSSAGGTPSGGGTAGAGITETFTWGPNNPGIIMQPGPSGAIIPVGVQVGSAIYAVQSITVNGAAQQPVDYGAYAGQVAPPPTWFYPGAATGNPSCQLMPSLLSLSTGDTVVVSYTPYIASGVSAPQYGTRLAPPAGTPLGTCGSGIWEGAMQVKDITSQADLDNLAAQELSRIGGVPWLVKYQTDYAGLMPGQQQSVNVPKSGADNLTVLITQVTGTFIAAEFGTGGSFRWDIEGRTNLDPGNAWKWYERLVARTQNPLPTVQQDVYTFVSPASGNLAGGATFGNPLMAKRTGKLTRLRCACGTGPVNQDLHVWAEVNGSPLGHLVVPAGTAANTAVVVDLTGTGVQWIFQDDVITAYVSYSVTGASPANAKGVTFDAIVTV